MVLVITSGEMRRDETRDEEQKDDEQRDQNANTIAAVIEPELCEKSFFFPTIA